MSSERPIEHVITYAGERIGTCIEGRLTLDSGVKLSREELQTVMSMVHGGGKGFQPKVDNIRHIPATTTMTAEQALNAALMRNLEDVLIVGYHDDSTIAVLSSRMSRAEALFMMEKAKDWIMNR
jgi:hypothetical protein